MEKSLEGFNNLPVVIFMGKIRAEKTYFFTSHASQLFKGMQIPL